MFATATLHKHKQFVFMYTNNACEEHQKSREVPMFVLHTPISEYFVANVNIDQDNNCYK